MTSNEQDNGKYEVYCLNFNNENRRHVMTKEFNKFEGGLDIKWHKGVDPSDSRISPYLMDENMKKTWSTCYGHLDMINAFVSNSNKEHAIFCEDDILIRNDFIKHMPELVTIFNQQNLDVLLLGYLCENRIDQYNNFPEKPVIKSPGFPFKILDYIGMESVWGTQMYMLSKKQARILLNKYYVGYAERTLRNPGMTPFSADWTITKDGNHALVYPLLVIENGNTYYDNYGQLRSHNACYNFSYSKHLFD